MAKQTVKTFVLLVLLLISSPLDIAWANAADDQVRGIEWGVIHLGWNGSTPKIESGNLKIRFIGGTKGEMGEGSYIYSFIQEAELAKKPKLVLVSACSIVENLDTNGGDAGVLHLPDTKKIAIYMRVDESFLIAPRVCMNVQY